MLRSPLILLSLVFAAPAVAESGPEGAPEDYATESLAAYERLAPVGMAVAVVRKGEPVWLGGYGLTRIDGGEPVTGDTVFPVHSMTKSFTAAALALLVDEGKIAWSDPVRKHVPQFAMSDPYVTEHLTVRDLLVHNSGLALGAGDLLSWPDQVSTNQEVIAALRHLPLDSGFREGFAYDNILYTVAGEVVARASGMEWGEFVERRLFAPLEMASCSVSSARAKPLPTAVQHSRPAGGDAVSRADIEIIEDPAGSISCSARDIARWTQFQLDRGTLADGSRLMAAERFTEMHTPVVALGPPNFMQLLAGAHFNDYALGWFASDFAGSYALEHGGSGPGGLTNMILLPEHDAAVVVLVNDMVPAHFLSYRLADLIVRGAKASDWLGWIEESQRRRVARTTEESSDASPPPGAEPPSLALSAYAGTYRDPWYGTITVAESENGLRLHLSRSKLLEGPLIPWDGETFLARWPDRSLEADALVTFDKDTTGRITGMSLRALSDRTDFSYDYHHLAPVRIED